MKIVIVGAGVVGTQLARQLISEKKDVVLIEHDPELAARAGDLLDCLVITGEGTSREILARAGTADADFFVAATGSDEVNMIACGVVSSEFEVRAKVARISSVEYHSSRLSEKRFLGIDYVVNPEIEAARAIIRAVDSGAISDIMVFEQSLVQIRNIVVENGGPLVGKTVQELSAVWSVPFLIAVIIRDNRYLIPSGDSRLQLGDMLYVVANEIDFDAIFGALGKTRSELRRILLIGGGRIARHVVQHLNDPRPQSLFARFARRLSRTETRSVKIIERDYNRCKALAEEFPDALVIHADVSDDGVFEEQHFANSDLVIAVTDNQELNIVTALYAKTLGVKRSVVLVNRARYVPVAAQIGIDVPVSQKNAMVTTILRFIRSGAVKSIHTISDGQIEAIELTVTLDSRSVGTAIRDLPLPKDSLIVALERDGQSLVPGGANVIRGNDHLIVIARKEHADRVQHVFTN